MKFKTYMYIVVFFLTNVNIYTIMLLCSTLVTSWKRRCLHLYAVNQLLFATTLFVKFVDINWFPETNFYDQDVKRVTRDFEYLVSCKKYLKWQNFWEPCKNVLLANKSQFTVSCYFTEWHLLHTCNRYLNKSNLFAKK